MAALLRDLRYSLRALCRNPVFTVAAVITLGLGIGCSTAIFSAFNATVLHPLPYPDAGRIVRIEAKSDSTGAGWRSMPLADVLEIQNHKSVFKSVGFYGSREIVNLTGAGVYARIDTLPVSAGIFKVSGVRPTLGRRLRPEDMRPGNNSVVVISHSLWMQHFAGDRSAIGKTIRLDNMPYVVVGVMSARFSFPDPFIQAWIPQTITAADVAERGAYGTPLLARLKPGVTLQQADAALNTLARRIAAAYPDTAKALAFRAVRLEDEVAAPVSDIFWLLLGGVGVALLIACANVANLLLARNAAREHEFAVRISLGAGRLRMARLVFSENMMLAVMGGLLGLGISSWGLDGLRVLASGSVARLNNAAIDGWVLGFAFGLSVMTGILFGFAPLLQVARLELNRSLKGTFNASPEARGSRFGRPQSILTVIQVALVVILLAGAGLMLRSLSNLLNAPLGFDPHNLLGAMFEFPLNRPSNAEMLAFQEQVLAQTRGIHGVQSAALGSNLPFHGGIYTWFLYQERDAGWVESPGMEENMVGPDYFTTMRIPMLRGRTFSRLDSSGAPCVVTLNQTAASALWPSGNAVGKVINLSAPPPLGAPPAVASEKPSYCEVVGEVGNARFAKLVEEPGPETYFSRLQKPAPQPVLMVRTAGNPLALANVILDRVNSIDKNQRVMWAFSMDQLIDRSALQPRFRAVLLSLFAGLTLLIAAFGVYGVMSYSVSRRTKELGIRMAFGAQRSNVLWMVVREGVLLSCVGIALGLAASLAAVHTISKFLYGVRPADPVTFVVVSALLVAVAALASYLPARRATKIDPVAALRYE